MFGGGFVVTKRHISTKSRIRQARIAELVSTQSAVTVEGLAADFEISPETVRRDLSILADAGRIRKVHGGARSVQPKEEGPFEDRMNTNTLAKQLIAEKVARLVSPGQSLFMDTGSTTLICAEVLAQIDNLTVITNSCRIAATFANGSGCANVYLLGGMYRADNAQSVGEITVEEVSRYNADFAILTVGTIDTCGAMDFSQEEAQVGRAMLTAASQAVVVVDSTKFNRKTVFNVCDLSQIDILVVDSPLPDGAFAEAVAVAEIEVL